MGQKIQGSEPPTLEAVNKNVDLLFGQLYESKKIDEVNNPIIDISRNFC